MILDHIKNAGLYASLSPRFRQAFDFIRATDLSVIPEGRHEIDGDRLFVIIFEYLTKEQGRGIWEAHRRYIDLQYIVRGTEQIWWGQLSRFQQGAYDEARDFLPMVGKGECLTLNDGDFMVLFPDDAHMPSMAVDAPVMVKKAVFKIAVN
jgi:YhcH/YjgK/YiaL family protein